MIQRIIDKEIGNVKVNVVFVGEKRMRNLNKSYKSADYPTDVLTFVYQEDDIYAEIFVCPSIVEKNALKYKETFERELVRTLIHSCLHIAGYDHEMKDAGSKEMFEKQERYLRRLGLDDSSSIQGN